MASNSSLLLGFLAGLAYFGAGVVIIGVALEGCELIVKLGRKKRNRKWVSEIFGEHRKRAWMSCIKHIKPRILPLEAIGFSLLIVGLAIEWAGSFAAGRLQSRENAILESTNFALSLQIEELHSNNLVLQLKLQPRIITLKQITNFIFLTQKIPKIPVRVSREMGDETFNYAWQLRYMLGQARFGIPNSETNFLEGIESHEGLVFWNTTPQDTNEWDDVTVIVNNTNSYLGSFSVELTNGFSRPIITGRATTSTNAIYTALAFCMMQIQMRVGAEQSAWMTSNQCEFVVRQKPQ